MKKLLLVSLFIFTLPAIGSGINANSASAPCTNNTLETYSGNSNLQADWQPNEIQLRWYNENERLTVQQSAQSCTYDGTLTIPSTQPTRTGYTFAGWEVRLPSAYTELEYLQNNIGATIDTGVPGDNNYYDITTDFMVIDLPQDVEWHSVFANFVDEEHNLWRLLIHKNRGLLFYVNTRSNTAAIAVGSIQLNQRYLIEFNRGKVKINDNNYTFSNFPSGKTNNTTIKIISSGGMITRIYSFVIKDNANTLFNGIPAKRNSDNAIGMYDTVTQTFFTNSGTGTFIAGPVVQ